VNCVGSAGTVAMVFAEDCKALLVCCEHALWTQCWHRRCHREVSRCESVTNTCVSGRTRVQVFLCKDFNATGSLEHDSLGFDATRLTFLIGHSEGSRVEGRLGPDAPILTCDVNVACLAQSNITERLCVAQAPIPDPGRGTFRANRFE